MTATLAVSVTPSHAAVEFAGRIELPDASGRLDHLAIDAAGNRLFVAALGADSIEVVDLKDAKRALRLRGKKPQGLAYVSSAHQLFIANGGSGIVEAYESDVRKAAIADLPDVDNLRLDGKAGLLYAGYSDGLAVIDPVALRLINRFALPGHPESFQLATDGAEIYINVPTSKRVVVVDRRSGKITASWDVSPASQNFPMALDEANRRLLVATRQPARLQVYDTSTGRRVAEIPLCGDADDLFFDADRRQAYAVCGEGRVDVVRQLDADRYELKERIDTVAGARTGLFVSSMNTLFVAAPSRHARPAAVQIYRIK